MSISLAQLKKAKTILDKLTDIKKEIKLIQKQAEILVNGSHDVCFKSHITTSSDPLPSPAMLLDSDDPTMSEEERELRQMMMPPMWGSAFQQPLSPKKGEYIHLHINEKEALHVLGALMEVKKTQKEELTKQLQQYNVTV